MKDLQKTMSLEVPVWGVSEVCAYTGLDRRAVYRMTDEGVFRNVRITEKARHRRYVPREVVAKWAELCGTEARA